MTGSAATSGPVLRSLKNDNNSPTIQDMPFEPTAISRGSSSASGTERDGTVGRDGEVQANRVSRDTKSR